MQNTQNGHTLPEIINKTWKLDRPDLEEIGTVMEQYLSPCFNDFRVDVVQCPDLSIFPYYLTARGLCGHTEVIQFGNDTHLYNPSKNKAVSWNLPDLINRCTTKKTAFAIGGSMFRGVPNKEVFLNMKYSREQGIHPESHCVFLNEEERVETECLFNSYLPLCDLYGSFYVCDGRQNAVLKVYAKEARDPDMHILHMMRHALCCRYFNACVGLSGLLFINNGPVEAGCMPRTFPEIPLNEKEEIYRWYHKYNISAPVLVHNIMFNFNELDVKLENEQWPYGKTTCMVNPSSSYILRANQYTGSKFLKPLTPSTTEFNGYFNVVSKLHRIGAELILD